MYQLKIGTIPLPKLYVCENSIEATKCRRLGIPYLIKPRDWSDEKLIKAVLWHTLNEKFPSIKWHKIIGYPDVDVKVYVPAEIEEVSSAYRENTGIDSCHYSSSNLMKTDDEEYRETGGGIDPKDKLDFNSPKFDSMRIDDYIGQIGFYVKVEELQQLKLLPVFLDDIANAIKINIMNTTYMDGYNKKLECNLGTWQGNDQAPNLIILDVSGSIPGGVAGTMVSLIDSLRHQANADLIITSHRSEYWAANTELPSPDKLRYLIGGCNECVQFYQILRDHVLGKHWGNVIVFGDYDSPLRKDIQQVVQLQLTSNIKASELQSTRIDRIMAFHTSRKEMPGYGLWAEDASPHAEKVYNTDWVDCMRL